jgi:hypothetical protein
VIVISSEVRRRENIVEIVLIFWVVVLALLMEVAVMGWVGTRIKPVRFPAYPEPTPAMKTAALPADLPAPVARYYKEIIGDSVPVIESAVITGSARLRFVGVTFPARLRFTHDAGKGYRHYIEATVFGRPLLKVNEHYLDGKSRLRLPFGVVENEPKVDMAANLGLWGESVWLPSIFVTDKRVRWEAIDDTSARLVVPFGGEEDTFTVTFDPQTGLIRQMEAQRWKNVKDEEKTRWMLEPLGWATFHGIKIPSPASVKWENEGSPWLVMTVEDVAYNVDVSEYVRAKGL